MDHNTQNIHNSQKVQMVHQMGQKNCAQKSDAQKWSQFGLEQKGDRSKNLRPFFNFEKMILCGMLLIHRTNVTISGTRVVLQQQSIPTTTQQKVTSTL